MDKIDKTLPDVIRRLNENAKQTKELAYRFLWVKVNFSVVRDGHMRQVGARAFGVFFVIRTYMNKNNVAFPSLKRIAYDSKLSVNTVKKEIQILIKHGWLIQTVERNENGRFENAEYLILENDLIRGTNSQSFMKQPVSKIDNGYQPEPISNIHNGNLMHKKY